MDVKFSKNEAITLSSLLTKPESWISRVVEKVEFLPEGQTRTYISIDLDIHPIMRKHNLFPIISLKKRLLRSFSVIDQAGNSLPVLTYGQNADLGRQLLISGVSKGADKSAVTEVIDSIVKFEEGNEFNPRDLLNEYSKFLSLENRDQFLSLASLLNSGFIIWVKNLGLNGEERTVSKISFENKVNYKSPQLNIKRFFRAIFSLDKKGLIEALSPEPLLPSISYHWSNSYHLEIVAPRGLIVSELNLVAEKDRKHYLLSSDSKVPTQIGHVTTRSSRINRFKNIKAIVSIKNERDAFSHISFFSAFTVFILQTLPIFIHFGFLNILERSASQNYAPLLLVAPGLLLPYLAKGNEHGIKSHRLRYGRFSTYIVSGLLLADSVLLILRTGNSIHLFPVWILIGIISFGNLLYTCAWYRYWNENSQK